jgi:hypothetical protein
MIFKKNGNKIPFLAQDEKKIIQKHVFLEESLKPSSFSGTGIPHGILLLTNKRLFFFYTGVGELKNMIIKSLPGWLLPIIADEIGGEAISKLVDGAEVIEEGIELIYEKLREEKEYIEYFDHERSFVIPLKRIYAFERTPFYLYYLGLPALKKNYFTFEIFTNRGKLTTYCVYSHNPTRPFNAMRIVNPILLNRKMKKALSAHNEYNNSNPSKKHIYYNCMSCGNRHSENYCPNCGSKWKKSDT